MTEENQEKTEPKGKKSQGITVPKATVLAAICSLISAALVAWIGGVFDTTEAELVKARDEAVEKVRQEGSVKTEEIRQLTAKIVEGARSEGSVRIEQFKLQRDLILQAIDTEDRGEAQKRLRFFAQTGLIPDYSEKVLAFTDEKDIEEIPSITQNKPQLPQLIPWRGEFSSIMSRTVRVLHRDFSVCSAFALTKNIVITLDHCVSSQPLENLSVEIDGRLDGSIKIIETQTIQSGLQIQELSRLVLSKELDIPTLDELTFRRPEIGEKVAILGHAPGHMVDNSYLRGLRRITDYKRFYSECSIINVVDDEGYVSTDCDTPNGTSGSVIIGKSDGAVISLVAWGRTA